ncbi:MAG TPA: exodeoxyribonuclease VII small subunit [bacterium]|nr:exodeoxyribonuclease VII small subunit [bacterium]
MNKAGEPTKKLTFEEAFEQLEQLTEILELGNLSLEATLKAFKQGKELLKYCENLIEKAEESLTIIDFDDQPAAMDQLE